MKAHNSKPLFVALSVFAVAAVGSARQASAQALNCDQGLEFGTFMACAAPGTATLSPTGSLSTTGCLAAIGSSIPGTCILTGIAGTSVITVAGPGNIVNGGNNIAIDNFLLQVSGSSVASPSIVVTAPSVPALVFNVGARLNISAGQTGGNYSGTYTVTTNYP